MKKISYTKNPAPANRMFSSEKPSEENSESLLLFLFLGTEFPEVVASFLCSMERNFELFSLPWNGSEQNSESLLFFVPWYRISSFFLLCGTVRKGMPRVLCSA